MNVYEKLYMSWRFEALTPSFAMRAGLRECGCSLKTPEPFDYEKCQSLVEHATGVRTLVEGVLTERSIKLDSIPAANEDYQYIIMSKTASLHDSPEAFLSGDICANGAARNEAFEDLRERNVFEEQLLNYPSWLQAGILKCFLEFQGKDTPRGWLIYCADKIDAILTAMEYAANGRPGSVFNSSCHSAQDDENYLICGTDIPFECWTVRFFWDIVQHSEYNDISRIFVNILLAGREYHKDVTYIDSSGADRKISSAIHWINRFNVTFKTEFPFPVSFDSV